ncbi:unnamed protein product [Rotaria socialis]|uniref:N-acetyltransferase domain-containing protein n=1 Tax=Rotaria socialis TaxID=392032 RepID=A0A818IMG1_9BILA|nr:unnamed protein product [Rotaria socialis]CAF4672121.1 unnamed protein product [Rotaria socialis]
MTREIPTEEATVLDYMNQNIGNIILNWTQRPHPLSNSLYHRLQGQYCQLELLNTKADNTIIEQLYHAFKSNEETHFKYLKYGPFKTVDEFKQLIATKEKPSSDTVLYTIFVHDIAVGFISYIRINQDHGTIEIGNVNFSQDLVRTRQATEAMFLLIQFAFDTLGYRRIEWKCNAFNIKSRHAAIRLGFQYEGTWLKAEICKNRSRDNAWFSIVDDEWPPIKEELQRWLNSNNFDLHGQQLTKLNASQVNPRHSKIIDLN